MTEQPSPMNKVEHFVKSHTYEAKSLMKAIDWRLDKYAREAREELITIRGELHLSPEELPKVLQFKAGNREYISIRRVEGQSLTREENDPEGDSYESLTHFEVGAQLLPEGAIGVLVYPSGADCINRYMFDEYGLDNSGGWEFEKAMMDGAEYRREDWKLHEPGIVLLKNQGGNIYCLEGFYDKIDDKRSISKLEADGNGKVGVVDIGWYLSDNEMQVKRGWYKDMAKFYVVVEGSSEKQANIRRLTQLKPATAEQTQES